MAKKKSTSHEPDKFLGIHNDDARNLDERLPESVVDVTITSPPYYDLKNYGHPEQIGYGQTYDTYLDDLEEVFRKVNKVTKPTGSLWVVIDMFKKDGEVVPLPFDFVHRIKRVGWKLQEVIIWEKDRTVPWAHTGQMRNAFEYILVFSKSKKPKFHLERVKDTESLKHWWIRYPERYNPKGKSPTSIWTFDIPTQGSWGKGYIRHFCPLPEALISRILRITTDENDLVLDPFAGSGAVLSLAASMNRNYVGFELNPEYIEMFQKYNAATLKEKRLGYEKSKKPNRTTDDFTKTILDLRSLKFARILFQHTSKLARNPIYKIFVEEDDQATEKPHKLVRRNYHLFVGESISDEEKDAIIGLTSSPPLSKYGIDPKIIFYKDLPSFTRKLRNQTLYLYSTKNTHSLKKEFAFSDLGQSSDQDVIISGIKVEIDESLYQ